MKKLNYKELLKRMNKVQHEYETTIKELYEIDLSNGMNIVTFGQFENKSAIRALKKIETIIRNELIKTIDSFIDTFSKGSFECFCNNNSLQTLYKMYTGLKGDGENE